MGKYSLIVKSLRDMNKSWDSQLELFADNGELCLIDRISGEILEAFPNVICDGGDPDKDMRGGKEYIIR